MSPFANPKAVGSCLGSGTYIHTATIPPFGSLQAEGVAWPTEASGGEWRRHLRAAGGPALCLAARDEEDRERFLAAHLETRDLQKAFFAFTMDTFAEIAFGAALDSQNTDHRFTQAFDTAQQLCNDRFGRPWFSLLKLLKTPSEAAIEREVGIMRGFALGIVQGRRRGQKRRAGWRSR